MALRNSETYPSLNSKGENLNSKGDNLISKGNNFKNKRCNAIGVDLRF